MLKIGCHLSISKGYYDALKTAIKLQGNTFQHFSRNPRGGSVKEFSLDDFNKYQKLLKENIIFPPLAHAPYTLNPCSSTKNIRDFAKICFKDDLKALDYFEDHLYVFHPGSHVGQGTEKGIELCTDLLNEVLREDQKTIVLIETMSGKGSEIGKTFEEVNEIIKNVKLKDKIGVCLDTCHIYSAGYDIVNDLDNVLKEFDDIIGLKYLKAIHLNDSQKPFNSHLDRHEKIGQGTIGLEAIKNIINHKLLRELPFYLETPNEEEGYLEEIKLLKSLYEE